MKRNILIFIIGFALGAGSVWLYLDNDTPGNSYYLSEDSQMDEALSENGRVPLRNVAAADNRIVVPSQESGGVITVQFVSFRQPGWIVIHELLNDGSLGNALGAQRFDQGEYSGGVSLLRVTESGNSYAAVLYTDNGDKRFDVDIDLPELDNSNNPIQAIFTIL